MWADFLADDRLHPNDRGHKIMADMVVFLLQQTAVDLLTHPMSIAEAAASRMPLLPPMFEGACVQDVFCMHARVAWDNQTQ
jgi:UDP-glucose:glycoprotein glucosyltransferase